MAVRFGLMATDACCPWATRPCCPRSCESLIILRLPRPERAATFACVNLVRDSTVRFITVLLLLMFHAVAASAQSDSGVSRSHGFTILGQPALPPDFRAFPYVNVNA